MTDIIKLAREILEQYPTWVNMINADAAHPAYSIELLQKGEQLAQAVIDRHNKPSQGESRMTISSRAKAEQREKDAEIAQDHDCDEWPGMCNCRGKIAKAIRDAKS